MTNYVIDEQEIWEGVCEVAAQMSGVSVDRARALLDAAGFGPFGRGGILEEINIVRSSVGLPELRPDGW